MKMKYPGRERGWKRLRRLALAFSLMVSILSIIGGSTVAYLVAQSSEVVNVFEPVSMGGEADEEFKDNLKNNIKVKNNGDIPVYVRVKLQPVWVTMDDETPVGKAPWEPNVDGQTKAWIYDQTERCYYYKTPLEPGKETEAIFAAEAGDTSIGIRLTKGDDNTRQQLIVMAQLIQSSPAEAVETVWAAVQVNEVGELELKTGAQEGN